MGDGSPGNDRAKGWLRSPSRIDVLSSADRLFARHAVPRIPDGILDLVPRRFAPVLVRVPISLQLRLDVVPVAVVNVNTANVEEFVKEAQSIDQPYTVLEHGGRWNSSQLARSI